MSGCKMLTVGKLATVADLEMFSQKRLKRRIWNDATPSNLEFATMANYHRVVIWASSQIRHRVAFDRKEILRTVRNMELNDALMHHLTPTEAHRGKLGTMPNLTIAEQGQINSDC